MLSFVSNAQCINIKQDSCWVDIGYGIYFSGGSNEPSNGKALMLGFNVQQNKLAYKLRFMSNKEFDYIGPSPKEHFSSLGLMMGKIVEGKKSQTHLSAGIGFTSGTIRGTAIEGIFPYNTDYNEKKFFAPSLPLEIEYIRKCTSKTGYAITYFADLNAKRPYYGFALKVLIGRLKHKPIVVESTEPIAQ